MLTTVALVEVLAGVAGKVSKTFVLVLYSMAVDNVHDDGNSQFMSAVNERLQFLGGSTTAAGGKETADMVTKTSVIGMFLDGHNLDAVISAFGNTGQHVVTELYVCANLLGILSHSHMTFIDEEGVSIGLERGCFPLIFLLGCPYLGAENMSLFVLNHTTCPCGDALALTAFPVHAQLIQVAMLEGCGWKFQFPIVCSTKTLEGILRIFLPSIAITHKINFSGIGRPFSYYPSLLCLVQTEIEITAGKITQRTLSLVCKLAYLAHGILMTAFNSCRIVLQIRVVLNQFEQRSRLCLLGGSGRCRTLLCCRFLCCSLGTSGLFHFSTNFCFSFGRSHYIFVFWFFTLNMALRNTTGVMAGA